MHHRDSNSNLLVNIYFYKKLHKKQIKFNYNKIKDVPAYAPG